MGAKSFPEWASVRARFLLLTQTGWCDLTAGEILPNGGPSPAGSRLLMQPGWRDLTASEFLNDSSFPATVCRRKPHRLIQQQQPVSLSPDAPYPPGTTSG